MVLLDVFRDRPRYRCGDGFMVLTTTIQSVAVELSNAI
jgi:hypothetical protein